MTNVYPDYPETSRKANLVVFIFYKYVTIVLSQGQHLQRGSRLMDFDIRLGDSMCVPVSLTDNQIDCRPPTNKPNNNSNDAFCPDDALSLSVCIRAIYTYSLITTKLLSLLVNFEVNYFQLNRWIVRVCFAIKHKNAKLDSRIVLKQMSYVYL